VRSIEFVIKVGAGTVKASNFELSQQTSYIMTIVKQKMANQIKKKITMVMFILLNNVTTYAENVHHFVPNTNGPYGFSSSANFNNKFNSFLFPWIQQK
jgi:hypothetical protein